MIVGVSPCSRCSAVAGAAIAVFWRLAAAIAAAAPAVLGAAVAVFRWLTSSIAATASAVARTSPAVFRRVAAVVTAGGEWRRALVTSVHFVGWCGGLGACIDDTVGLGACVDDTVRLGAGAKSKGCAEKD